MQQNLPQRHCNNTGMISSSSNSNSNKMKQKIVKFIKGHYDNIRINSSSSNNNNKTKQNVTKVTATALRYYWNKQQKQNERKQNRNKKMVTRPSYQYR